MSELQHALHWKLELFSFYRKLLNLLKRRITVSKILLSNIRARSWDPLGLKRTYKSKIKTILETFFSHDIDISKWRFVGVLGYDVDQVRCCSDCKPFVIKSSELNNLFCNIEEEKFLLPYFQTQDQLELKSVSRRWPIMVALISAISTYLAHQSDKRKIKG